MRLNEKAIDRYYQLFTGLDEQSSGMVQRGVEWAFQNLKRQVRITWWLRWWRVYIELSVGELYDDTNITQKGEVRRLQLYEKAQSYQSPLGIENSQTSIPANWPERAQRGLPHWVSLEVPEIQQLQWTWQHPMTLLEELAQLERAWQERVAGQKEWIDHERAYGVPMDSEDEDDPEIILQFPDGYAWWNLKRPYCDQEGEAMGHCGNAAARDGTVLSLRLYDGKRKRWRPVCTFILHHGGILGEMKGRGNKKPESKYHPYIVALIRSPLVNGVEGGGHAPEENFSLDDLDHKEKVGLIADKPELGGLGYWWIKSKRNINDPDLLRRLNTALEKIDGGYSDSNMNIMNRGKLPIVRMGEQAVVLIQRYHGTNQRDSVGRLIYFMQDTFPIGYLLYDGEYNSEFYTRESWLKAFEYLSPTGTEKLIQLGGTHSLSRIAQALVDRDSRFSDMIEKYNETFTDPRGAEQRIIEYFPYMERTFASDSMSMVKLPDGDYGLVMAVNDFMGTVLGLLDLVEHGENAYEGSDHGDLLELKRSWIGSTERGLDDAWEAAKEDGMIVDVPGQGWDHHGHVDSMYGTGVGIEEKIGATLNEVLLGRGSSGKIVNNLSLPLDHDNRSEVRPRSKWMKEAEEIRRLAGIR